MIQIALEQQMQANADTPQLVEMLSTYKESALEMLAQQKCVFCDGYGHSVGPKCPTFLQMKQAARAAGTPEVAQLFTEDLETQFKNYNVITKVQIESLHKQKMSALGSIQNEQLTLSQRAQRKGEYKLALQSQKQYNNESQAEQQ